MLNKTKLFFLIFCLILLNHSRFSQAQGISVHASVGINSPKESSITSGIETGFGFSYSLAKKINVSFDFGNWRGNAKEEPGSLFEGRLSISSFLVSLRYAFFEKKTLIPYTSCGAGLIFSSFNMEDLVTIPEVTIHQKVENGIAFFGVLGTHLYVANNFSTFAEVLYVHSKTTGITTVSDLNFGTSSEEFPLNLSSFIFRVGLRYII